MNKKNIFLTFGLALGLGVAVTAGLSPRKEVLKVNAATDETMIYIKVESDCVWNDWGFTASKLKVKLWKDNEGTSDAYIWNHELSAANGGFDVYEKNSVTYYGFSRTYYSTQNAGCVYYDDKGNWAANYTNTFTFADAPTGSNLLKVSGGSNTGPVSPSFTWDILDTSDPTYTVTKLAVEFVDGVAQSPADWSLGSDVVVEGSAHSTPAAVSKNLEHFGGWFTDATCETEYTGTASVTADFTIYAKFTRLTLDSYIYFAMNNGSAVFNNDNAYVTFFGDYAADIQLSTLKISDVLLLNNEGKIYKIPMPSSGDYGFYIHSPKGESNLYQTEDVTPVLTKCMYTWYHNKGDNNNDYYSWNFSNDAAEACAFLESAEYLREHVVPVSGKILQYSVCGIEPSDAAELYEAYEGLGTNALSMVNNSYTYTYNGKYDGVTVPGEDNIKYEKIMEQIYEIALRDADFAKDHPASGRIVSIFGGVDTNTSSVLLIVVGALALVSVGGFLVFRKREN